MNAQVNRHLDELVARMPELAPVRASVAQVFSTIRRSLQNDGVLFTCGNGGSAADAEHIVGELVKGFLSARQLDAEETTRLTASCSHDAGRYLAAHLQRGMRAIALTGHPSLATAVANDMEADLVFAQQLYVLGRCGDVLLAISTSGDARNVLLACEAARARAIAVVGLTGREGGRLRDVADVCVCVPSVDTFLVQEQHVPVYHALCAMLETSFFGRPGGGEAD